MTLVLDLPPDVEARLITEAARHGIDTAAYALRLLEKTLPNKPLTARDLLALPPEARRPFLEASAATMEEDYRSDLARSVADRELTAFTALDGEDFRDE